MDNVDLSADDYEYPNTTLIVAKYLKIPPKSQLNPTTQTMGQLAYIDGITND